MEQWRKRWVSEVRSDVEDSYASAPLGWQILPQVRLRFGNDFFSFLSIIIDIVYKVQHSSLSLHPDICGLTDSLERLLSKLAKPALLILWYTTNPASLFSCIQ